MSDDTKPNQLSTTEDAESAPLDIVTNLALDTTIPAPIRKNVFKAFDRLCSALIDVPVGAHERRSAEKRAESEDRIKIREEIAAQIVQQMKVDPEYAQRAVKKYGEKIIREQVNLDKISALAANELKKERYDSSTDQKTDGNKEMTINDDWLNTFDEEARQKSTEDIQLLFGRILAWEIRQAGSYSMKAVKILGALDRNAAILFKNLCSVCIVHESSVSKEIYDARVPTLGRNPRQNTLINYGLRFDQLNLLTEYDLIISDYDSWHDYSFSMVNENNPINSPFRHQGRHWGLQALPKRVKNRECMMKGIALSHAGCELFRIFDLDPMEGYTEDLKRFFAAQHLQMVEIPTPNKT